MYAAGLFAPHAERTNEIRPTITDETPALFHSDGPTVNEVCRRLVWCVP